MIRLSSQSEHTLAPPTARYRLSLLLFPVIQLFVSYLAAADVLPRPTGLEAEIGFWHGIFTKYSSQQGVIHDDRHLGVVYGVIDIPDGASSKERKRRYDRVSAQYKASLTRLAGRGATAPSGEDARILALWSPNIKPVELLKARQRLRMQQGLADRFREGMHRSGQWREHILASLKREGVPIELVALPHVESSFDPNAYSHAGATGMWQFTRSTGKRFMRVDHIVDERRDPFLSSDAAARLLKYNYSILQSWPLAITAYNHGVAGMRRAVKQTGSSDIEQIIRQYTGSTFRFASRNFYVAFLAALQADEEAREQLGEFAVASPARDIVIEIPYFVPAKTLSEAFGLPMNTLQALNIALMTPVWNGNKYIPRGYGLRVPTGSLGKTPAEVIAAIPKRYRFPSQLPDEYHKVRSGDTLSGIAKRYNTTVSQLLALNGLNNRHRIYAGSTLRLPTPNTMRQLAVAAPVMESLELNEPAVREPVEQNSEALLADPSDYQVSSDDSISVQPEETLGHYADWLQVPTQRLRNLNNRPMGQALKFGQRLLLDFVNVSPDEFVRRRIGYHRSVQESFFSRFRVSGEKAHVVRRGDTLWTLTQQRFRLPQWLLRQYNPSVDFNRLRPGMRLVIPQLQAIVAQFSADPLTLARD